MLTAYQRFETAVGLVLTLVIGAVALVALYRLVVGVFDTLVLQALNPLDHGAFQKVAPAESLLRHGVLPLPGLAGLNWF